MSKSYEETLIPSRSLPTPVLLGQVLVNVALSCPIWIATEHFFDFGPSNIGGATMGASIAAGFTQLACTMIVGRLIIVALEE